jgi:hypothetical protein
VHLYVIASTFERTLVYFARSRQEKKDAMPTRTSVSRAGGDSLRILYIVTQRPWSLNVPTSFHSQMIAFGFTTTTATTEKTSTTTKTTRQVNPTAHK